MNKVEIRHTSVDSLPGRGAELRATRRTGHAVGYGAVFYRKGDPATEYHLAPDIVERVAATAFDRAVREDAVVCCFNHDDNLVLGSTRARTLRLVVDKVGLLFDATLPNTTTARDIEELLSRGDVSGASFRFQAIRDVWSREGDLYVRTLEDVALIEVGPVLHPAYHGSTAGTGSLLEADPARARSEAEAAAARRARVIAIATRV